MENRIEKQVEIAAQSRGFGKRRRIPVSLVTGSWSKSMPVCGRERRAGNSRILR